jgi:hypothetical protein
VTKRPFECHITVDPVFGDELLELKKLATEHGFRVAELLMKKGNAELIQSELDSFLTGRDEQWDSMRNRMISLHKLLTARGYRVRRRKIEMIIIDERFQP